MGNLAGTLELEGRYSEAESLLKRTIELERSALGIEHPSTLASMTDLAGTLMKQGNYAEAEKLQLQVRDIQCRVLGRTHPDTAGSTYNLACLAAHQGDRDKALALLRDAVEHGLAPNVSLGMEDDSDLQALRGDPRFEALVRQLRQRITASSTNKH